MIDVLDPKNRLEFHGMVQITDCRLEELELAERANAGLYEEMERLEAMNRAKDETIETLRNALKKFTELKRTA